jgi:hypothetical protein
MARNRSRGCGFTVTIRRSASGRMFSAQTCAKERNKRCSGVRPSLAGLPWMAPETKKAALEKLNAFTPKIGYPDRWRDYSTYAVDRGSYAVNVMNGNGGREAITPDAGRKEDGPSRITGGAHATRRHGPITSWGPGRSSGRPPKDSRFDISWRNRISALPTSHRQSISIERERRRIGAAGQSEAILTRSTRRSREMFSAIR